MSVAIPSLSYSTHSVISGWHSSVRSGLHSCGIAAGSALDATAKKIKAVLASPTAQGVIGFGLGLGLHKVYMPLTQMAIKSMGLASIGTDPFSSLSLVDKLLYTPYICIIGPIFEELGFRADLQGTLQYAFESLYTRLGACPSTANIAARVAAVFFTSILFGLFHFFNATIFGCSPLIFLPQVVACTIMGLIFGLAKELTGNLAMPIGLHMGNNTLSWALNIRASL